MEMALQESKFVKAGEVGELWKSGVNHMQSTGSISTLRTTNALGLMKDPWLVRPVGYMVKG